ncbi:MAG: zf-TFIIB domain-containing protein [Anaerolineae bacterium]|nr:zf-TFIIB domain-containing protein [Anaerolineae bacterium]
MYCPVCDHVELKISERQGIEIDYCPRCRGIWLDRGELDKIIERASVLERDLASRKTKMLDDDDYYDEDDTDMGLGYPPRKRKNDDAAPRKKSRRNSIFEEIFDLFD